jgi:hypothetical protein
MQVGSGGSRAGEQQGVISSDSLIMGRSCKARHAPQPKDKAWQGVNGVNVKLSQRVKVRWLPQRLPILSIAMHLAVH